MGKAALTASSDRCVCREPSGYTPCGVHLVCLDCAKRVRDGAIRGMVSRGYDVAVSRRLELKRRHK